MNSISYKLSEDTDFIKGFNNIIDNILDNIQPILPKKPNDLKDFYHGEGVYSFLPNWGDKVDSCFDSASKSMTSWWNSFEISDTFNGDTEFFSLLSQAQGDPVTVAMYMSAKCIVVSVGKRIFNYAKKHIDFNSIFDQVQNSLTKAKNNLISVKNKVVNTKNKIVVSLVKTQKKVKAYINSKRESFKTFFNKTKKNINDKVHKTKTYVNNKVQKTKTYFNNKVDTFKTNLKTKAKNIKEKINEKVDKVKSFFRNIF